VNPVLPGIADIEGRPLAIAASAVPGFVDSLQALSGRQANLFAGDDQRDRFGEEAGYRRIGNVAIVPIYNTFINRGDWVGQRWGLGCYDGLRHTFRAACADETVDTILADVHCLGGDFIGAIETARALPRMTRDAGKRFLAHINGSAASAGYALISGADDIVGTESSEAGHIGIVVVHRDYSGANEKAGVKHTLIYAGAHKVDGNPLQPLTESARAAWQAEVDEAWDMLRDLVTEHRGLSDKTIRGFEARLFRSDKAAVLGLIDRVGTFDQVLAEVLKDAPRGNPKNPWRSNMSERRAGPVSQADHEAAIAAATQAATDRIVAAMNAEGVKGNAARMSAALDLAQKSPGMAAADIAAFVAGNVAGETDADRYERDRLAGQPRLGGLARPQPRRDGQTGQRNVARFGDF
jgi:ClpP class serine protease